MHFWSNEVQPDLFKNIETKQKKCSGNFLQHRKMEITVSYDVLVVVVITALMLTILLYTLGIERGKHLINTAANQIQPVQKAQKQQTIPVKQGKILPAQERAKIINTRTTVAPSVQNVKNEPLKTISNKYYTIQIASYLADKFAKAEETRWQKKGYKTLILKKGDYFVLCIGNFNDKKIADAALDNLKKYYKDCFVKTIINNSV